MKSSTFGVLFLIGWCWSSVCSEYLDVTSEFSGIIAGRITSATSSLTPRLALRKIRRVTYEPGTAELKIEADIDWEGGRVCNLLLANERLDIKCGDRERTIDLPVTAVDTAASEWVDIGNSELRILEGRIIRWIIRLQDERRLSILLLPAHLKSARRLMSSIGIRTLVEANLGIPSRRCQLELIEGPKRSERLIITCDSLQWEL